MMGGAYRFALSRADVIVQDPQGQVIATHAGTTVTIQDGVARATVGATTVATMVVAEVTRTGRKKATITAPDGSSWLVSKDCGCGGAGS